MFKVIKNQFNPSSVHHALVQKLPIHFLFVYDQILHSTHDYKLSKFIENY
jgi:hypothetical protein